MQNNYLMTDRELLGLTTRVLGVPEFRVFELAWQEWHGKVPAECDLEPAYFDFAIKGELPCWVRAYNRNTLQLCEEVGLDLSVTQSGHNVTLAVSPIEMVFAVMGLGVVGLMSIVKLL